MPYNFIAFIVVILGAAYVCSSAILYFFVAFVLAYLLNPSVNKLASWKVPRSVATVLMMTLFISFFMTLVSILSPILYHQSVLIIKKISGYQEQMQSHIIPQFMMWMDGVSPVLLIKVEEAVTAATQNALSVTGNLVSKLMQSSSVAINIISTLVLVPIIAFYILRDWQGIVAKAFDIIPNRMRAIIQELTHELDLTMAGYLRGQTYACLLMAAYYAIMLSALQIEASLVLGFCSGLLIIVPYIGAACAGLVCALIAGLQYNNLYYAVAVLGVFVIGNFIESNFISPKIIGDTIGLHPAWFLFGVIVGANLLGFLGILVAVPLTAALGTVIKFAVAQYKRSDFYKAGG